MCSVDADVIDLTGDDKDDLQRAIALSLEESNRAFRETGITDEEQAISRLSQEYHTSPNTLGISWNSLDSFYGFICFIFFRGYYC